MNELTIYNRIIFLFNKNKKKIKKMYMFALLWGFYALMVIIWLSFLVSYLKMIIVFVPLIPIFVFMFLVFRKNYWLAKKYPIVYNKWMGDDRFINELINRLNTRAETDPNHIKIDNYGLKYIDDIIEAYHKDHKKLANSLFNAIDTSNLIEEINFFKKFKKFTIDMNCYRNIV